jgi:hypothetical protein
MHQGEVHSMHGRAPISHLWRSGKIIVALDRFLTGQAQSQDVAGATWAG